MIVKCDQCSTKFKLDDTKIRNEGVKVRCSKCKHIFEVRKETSQDEPDFDSILSGLDSQPAPVQAAAPAPVAAPPEDDAFPQGSAESSEIVHNGFVAGSQAAEAPHDEFSFDDGATTEFPVDSVSGAAEPANQSDELEFGDFSFTETSGADATEAAAPGPAAVAGTPSEEDDFSFGDFTFGEEPTASMPQEATGTSPAPGDEKPLQDSGDFDFGDLSFSEEPAATHRENPSSDKEESFDQDATVFLGARKPAEENDSLDFGDFSFDEPQPDATADAARIEGVAPGLEATVKIDSFALSSDEGTDEQLPSFDFGDSSPVPVALPTAAFEQGADDFSFDGGFGTSTAATDEFSFDERSTSLSPGAAGEAVEPMLVPPDNLSPGKAVAPEPDSFDFGNFDFGDSSSAENSHVPLPLENRPHQATSAPAALAAEPDYPPPAASSAFEDDIPPLPISTRRKESPSISYAVLGICALVILGICGGGYYLFHKGASAFETLGLGGVAKSLGIESLEEGSIALKNPAPAFIVNQEAGELFVVTGEAVNNFKKPRASIQIKATLYGPKGEVLLQKIAYCGNVLTKEQLAVMPYAKIEAAMNNQFGDSLANLGVKPGKSIPFVVVLSQVPKNVGEYGLEVVSSTVASQ